MEYCSAFLTDAVCSTLIKDLWINFGPDNMIQKGHYTQLCRGTTTIVTDRYIA